jgi:hypothetical protein
VAAASCPPYKAALLERWNAGCHTAIRLFRGFQQRGCAGSYALITADEKLRVLAGSLRTALVEETTHRMLGLYLLQIGLMPVADSRHKGYTARMKRTA